MFEDLGIEMITIPLVDDGVCIESLTEVLQNETDVVGMICVPRHSNPSGEVYSDNNILEIFEVSKKYSEDFLILFDNAYLVHDFLPTRSQSDVWKLAQQVNAENNAVVVTSFSKVTFGGGGRRRQKLLLKRKSLLLHYSQHLPVEQVSIHQIDSLLGESHELSKHYQTKSRNLQNSFLILQKFLKYCYQNKPPLMD